VRALGREWAPQTKQLPRQTPRSVRWNRGLNIALVANNALRDAFDIGNPLNRNL